MRILVTFTFLVIAFGAFSQHVAVEKFDTMEKRWTNNSDTVYVVNYWATWCKPCVEELPDFIKLNEAYKNRKFKMILVSLDFPNHIENRVKPFITKNKIEVEVILLDDEANIWINKVNNDWDGAIPVTQVIQKNKKEFHQGSLNFSELVHMVEPKLK